VTDQQRRRRRVRGPEDAAPAGEPVGASTQTAPVIDDATGWVAAGDDAIPNERGLRGLIGGGSSQVGPAAALRARDAARPRPQDIARAEAELTVIRRNWTPRD
jgi:hypothetical protein